MCLNDIEGRGLRPVNWQTIYKQHSAGKAETSAVGLRKLQTFGLRLVALVNLGVVIFDAKKPAPGLEGPGAAGRPPRVYYPLAGIGPSGCHARASWESHTGHVQCER